MPQNWKIYKLEDAIEALIDYRGKTPKKTTSGIPLVTAKIVKHGRILEPNEFIAEEDYDKWMRRGFPEVGDVVLTVEAPLGEVAQLKDSNIALAQRIVTLRGKKGLLDSTYLKYFLQSNIGQTRLEARQTGTTVFGIKQSELRQVEIDCPVYEEQKSIASILSALDDKIELNLQTNRTLEEMAMALYKHWFVDFGPFQNGNFIDSELGSIPEGWEVKTLGLLALNKRANKAANAIDENDQYVGLEHLERSSLSIISSGNGSDVSSNKSKFESGDILFGKLRPYFKKVGVAPFDGVCSTDILVINPKNHDYFGFVLFTIFNDAFIDYTTTVSGGTRMPRVSWGDIANYKVVVPSDVTLIAQFDQIVQSHVSQQIANVIELQTLTKLRDTLLPKLISGEVRVKEAAQTVANAI